MTDFHFESLVSEKVLNLTSLSRELDTELKAQGEGIDAYKNAEVVGTMASLLSMLAAELGHTNPQVIRTLKTLDKITEDFNNQLVLKKLGKNND